MASILGYNTAGGDYDTAHTKRISSYDTSDAGGGVTSKIYAYVRNLDTVDHNILLGIYTDGGANIPDVLLTPAAALVIPASQPAAWLSVNYVATLAPSTKYWLAMKADYQIRIYELAAGGDNRNRNEVSAVYALPNPWSETSGSSGTIRYSIYAEYAPSGSIVPMVMAFYGRLRS